MTSSINAFWWTMAGLVIILLLIVVVAWVIARILASPFRYPYFVETFDVSRKRNVDIEDYIDRFLCSSANRKALRMHKERDNYTCQICGKYMPDEVGLHIDHIVPVAKGGKTVPSNLQVLCSKCNSSKGAKLVDED